MWVIIRMMIETMFVPTNWNIILISFISMSDVNEIRKEIASKYVSMCEKISHQPNNSLVRYFSNPAPKSFYLDLIFRGNDKLNFNSRLTDRDIILLTSALESN